MLKVSSQYIKKYEISEMDIIIKRSLKKGENFLWQNVQGSKNIFDISTIEMNKNINAIFVGLNHEIKIDHLLPIYVKLSHRDTVFKTKFLAGADDVVSVEIPEEFMAREMRRKPRFDFNFSQKNIIKVIYDVNLMKGARYGQDFQLKDVSSGGLSCLCPEKIAKEVEASSNFKVSLVRQKVLDNEIEMDFVYSKKIKVKVGNRTIEMFKLGFKFRKELTAQALKELFSTSFQVL